MRVTIIQFSLALLFAGCTFKTVKEEQSVSNNFSKEDIVKKVENQIRLVQIKSVDSKNNDQVCTGFFAGEKTVLTLAICIKDMKNIFVNGVAADGVYYQNQYNPNYGRSTLSNHSLFFPENLAVITFSKEIPLPSTNATNTSEIDDYLINANEIYAFRTLISTVIENKNIYKSQSIFMSASDLKNKESYLEMSEFVSSQFKSNSGDAGSPVVKVSGAETKIIGLGVMKVQISNTKDQNFLFMPFDIQNAVTKEILEVAREKIGASYEYLSVL